LILTGIGTSAMNGDVTALNSLQKSMALTPFEPRAGPIGGVGVAFVALIISLTVCIYIFDYQF